MKRRGFGPDKGFGLDKYVAIAQAAMQQALAYRLTMIFTIGLSFIWVAILYYLWRAAFAGRPTIAGFTFDDMRTYVVLAYALNALVSWRTGANMLHTIRTGAVVMEVVRPLNYCSTQLARATGFGVVEGLISLVITFVVGLLVLRIEPPASVASALLFVISLLIGFVTKALIVFSVCLLGFWTLNGVGLMWAQQAVIAVLSGTIVPIAFLPGVLQRAAELLPMRGIVSTPVTLYLGQADAGQTIGLLGLQLGWLVILWFGANLMWRRAFRAVEVQGG